MDRDRFLILTSLCLLVALFLTAHAMDTPEDITVVIVAWSVSAGMVATTIALAIRDYRRWVRLPLSAKLRVLIHACGGDPDAPAVTEFVDTHKGDEEFALVAPAIINSFRIRLEFRRTYAQPSLQPVVRREPPPGSDYQI